MSGLLVEQAVREIPEVTDSGAASVLPLSGANNRTDFEILGRPAPRPEEMPGSQNRWVDAGYLPARRAARIDPIEALRSE